LNILDLWQFGCVYSRDYGPSKPDPWMFNECMRICDSKPSNTVIFEDSVVGIKAARATGSETIEVKDSNNLIEILYEF